MKYYKDAADGVYGVEKPLVHVPAEWIEITKAEFDALTAPTQAEVDAAAKVSNSGANQLRAMFGLPLQASTVKMDASIWLHRMSLDDAIKLGITPYGNNAGCSVPTN